MFSHLLQHPAWKQRFINLPPPYLLKTLIHVLSAPGSKWGKQHKDNIVQAKPENTQNAKPEQMHKNQN